MHAQSALTNARTSSRYEEINSIFTRRYRVGNAVPDLIFSRYFGVEFPIMNMSTAVESLFPALIKAQSELKHAIKSAENPHFRSKYADLGAVWDAAKEALSSNDLAALQDAVCDENGLAVNTRIIHSSGEWIDFASPAIPLDKRSAHGIGSALTYGRRYSLSAALGIVADLDDDGNAASSDADAEPKQINKAGISAVRAEVTSACKEFHSCADSDTLLAFINTPKVKKLMLRVCADYPVLWAGDEENAGLKGQLLMVGKDLGVEQETAAYAGQVQQAAIKFHKKSK
jgi:hypothetical protein